MKKDLLISTPPMGRMWQIQSRTPMMHGPVRVPAEAAKEVMAAGGQVFEHNEANPEEKVELTTENFETVTFPSNVATEEELTAAVANAELPYVNLTAPITLTKALTISRPLTLNGNGHKITMTTTGKALTFTADSNLNDIVIESTAGAPETWSSSYGVQLYNGTYVVKGLSVKGCNAALLVGASHVTMVGDVDVSENGFGGLEISQSKSAEAIPVLDITDATIMNSTEAYGKPTIWIDSPLGGGELYGASDMTEAQIKDQRQFYLDASNSINPEDGGPTLTITAPETFVVGTPTEFTVSTTKGNYTGGNVKGTGEVISGNEHVQLLEYYETATGMEGWKELTTDFGPAAGFPLMDATSKFRVTFKDAGEIKFVVKIVAVDGGAEVVTKEATFTGVAAPAAKAKSKK